VIGSPALIALAQTELAMLGRTADEVAGALRHLGVQGRRGNPLDCPLARFLDRCFPGEQWAVHSWHHNAVFFGPDTARQSFALTAACRAFIRAFDARRYRDLEVC
jgi:hypothetical protein